MDTLAPLPEYDSLSLYPHKKTLSSSQVISYIKDPAEFYIEYHNGVKRGSAPMQIGRIFAAAYANRQIDYAAHLKAMGCSGRFINLFADALGRFPIIKGSLPEFPMIAELNGWEVRATLDDFDYRQGLIIENKTGKVAWTQERADQSPQITIQAWTYWKKHGKLPKQIILNWWDTGVTSYVKIKTFNTKRTVSQLKECEEMLALVISNIEAENFTDKII